MARRRAKIARIDDGVATFCFMLGAISGLYLFVLALSNFSPLDPKSINPHATNQASSSRWPANQCPIGLVCSLPGASTSARSDQLKNDIAMWNRFLVSFFLAAVFTILPVRQLVSAEAKAEARAASEEDKAYKTVFQKKEAAVDAARAADEELYPTVLPVPTAVRKQSEVLRRFETALMQWKMKLRKPKGKGHWLVLPAWEIWKDGSCTVSLCLPYCALLAWVSAQQSLSSNRCSFRCTIRSLSPPSSCSFCRESRLSLPIFTFCMKLSGRTSMSNIYG